MANTDLGICVLEHSRLGPSQLCWLLGSMFINLRTIHHLRKLTNCSPAKIPRGPSGYRFFASAFHPSAAFNQVLELKVAAVVAAMTRAPPAGAAGPRTEASRVRTARRGDLSVE